MTFNKIIIEKKIREFLEEDCSFCDISSEFILNEKKTSAKIVAKSSGYVSGLEEIKVVYDILGVDLQLKKKDGKRVEKGETIVLLEGFPRDILLGERVALNLLTHMSAITTSTRFYVDKIKKLGKKTRIACTRKTLPGLRIFEKKAVVLGGGDTHRFSLDDMILLKDTHLRYYDGNVEKLLLDVKANASFSKKIEVELEKVEDVLIAAQNEADIIMLDNMDPDKAKEAINLLTENGLRKKVLIEISGGVDKENLEDYLKCEPDIISTSKITLFPPRNVDFSLRFD